VSNVSDEQYAQRLYGASNKRWKLLLKYANPYRLHIRHLIKGTCLDVGAGFGRNLGYLNRPANVGVEPNPALRTIALTLGHNVVSAEDAAHRLKAESFDYLLFSHVLEHLTADQHAEILRQYLPYLKRGGKIVILIPQMAGFKHDSDHKFFWTPSLVREYLAQNELNLRKSGSFPLPSIFGNTFVYNQWFFVATRYQPK
jgi:SAM-dependent methyltransferase